jgi:hypothetical protein
MNANTKIGIFSCLLLIPFSLLSRDILVEGKVAYFHPLGHRFREIYGGGALYGGEITARFSECAQWFGFLSVDYFSKRGFSIGLLTPTKVSLLPIAFGVKYFMPFANQPGDFYVGLGFQPIRVHTFDQSSFVIQKQTRWAFGGIAKVGIYLCLAENFLVDLFFDYSFARISQRKSLTPVGPVIPLHANVSGLIIGIGVGWRF